MKKVVFIFGRFQVPTKGHAEMIHYGANYAHRNGAEFRVYTSKSQDPRKNPLPYRAKVTFLKQLFPGINIVDDPQATTAFAICKKLSDEGYDDVTMITGGDRVAEFKRSIGKYVLNRKDPKFDPKKNYGFSKFDVINSGERKAGISGTDMRNYIKSGKFDKFMSVAPTSNKILARKIFNTAKQNLAEEHLVQGMSRKDFHSKLMDFIDYTCDQLEIKQKPTIKYKDDKGEGQPSFGGYAPHSKELFVYTKNRHPMDIFRTVAHELVHHKQNLDGRLGKNVAKEGSTGSKIENEANSEAGKVMRYFGAENPFYFDMQYVGEQTAVILSGTPGSGKDKILKEAILPLGFNEVLPNNIIMEGNIVVNGANDYSQVKTIKEQLEYFGYKTMMVFVNTSDEVSKQRNEARATKGGRVINETVRFAKWQDAQDNLNRFDKLFEKVIEVKNDLDANKPIQVIQETYSKLIDAVSDEIQKFALSESDYKFERMLNEVGGAGNWGTDQLRQRYQKDTPGEEDSKIRPMKVIDKVKDVPSQAKPQTMPAMPIGADRIGPEAGYPKEPSFGDNQTMPFVSMTDPVARWMVKEETRKRFKEKYGKLAEQKLRETAEKLRGESLDDPFSAPLGMTPNSWNMEINRPTGGQQIDVEKQGIFGQRLSKKIKKLNKNK